MKVARDGEEFTIDASLLGELLGVAARDVQALVRAKEITSRCERGEVEHEGEYRLTFLYQGRRARLRVDETGGILHHSVMDLGNSLSANVKGSKKAP